MSTSEQKIFTVKGRVINQATRAGIEGLRVELWDKDLLFDDPLGKTITDAQGKFQITFHESDFQDFIIFGEKKPDLYFKVFQNELLIKNTEDSVLRNVSASETSVTIPVNLSDSGGETKDYDVQGKVASRVSAGVGGLRVVIVDKGVGGDVQLAQAVTDDRGAYRATFPDSAVLQRGKAQPDIQARVFAGETFLGASDVHYNASQHETLNVLLQDAAAENLRSEHEVLTSALAGQFTGKLADLKETDEQQDITYLANKTGWDARAVALAALADKFSAQTASTPGVAAIPQPFFYALFRAGLPANENTLFHTDAKTLESVWKQAAKQGVIPQASDEQIADLVQRFQDLSAQQLLTGPAQIGTSSFKELLLTVTQLNDTQQARFAQLYTTNRADMKVFWEAVRGDPAFGNTLQQRSDLVNRLQVDGKLAFLTINNAALMQKIHTTAGSSGLPDLLQLAQTGYYRTAAWNQLLTEEVSIPNEIPGDTTEAKRANYAEYLAAQVRLSYPTTAVAHMVKSGELPLTGAAPGVSDQVHAFLTGRWGENQKEFEIGAEPVERYIVRNKLQIPAETVTQVKRLQRTYQITPSDQAMTGLMKRGIDAAYHVVRYDRDTFIQNFAADLGGTDPAAQTYDRAEQIHSSVLNVALSYLHARTAPAIGVHSPPSIIDPVPANPGDIIPYATLESLFGSMDFCACSHCRSILSPAAYLVDLLQFLGADDKVWADFVSTWKSPQGEHEGAPYPFAKQAEFKEAGSPSNTELSPFTVLMSRRPDIQHLPLTCDNTNTALPYIDLVNETLEYFVASSKQNPSLKDYQGNDTNGMSSEDLLASPQYVMDEAYKTLRGESFPAPLPFHQPLENLRRYFNKFEVPLPLAMERLRTTDSLERGTNPYGWRDILMEEISLSRAEYNILTTSNATADELLWQIYGYPSGTKDTVIANGSQTDHIAALSNVKQFARRMDVSYEHLISILKTRFVNPNSGLLPKLEKLGVSFAVLAKLKTDNNTPNQAATDAWFDGLLASQEMPPDPAAYGGDPNGSKSDFSPIRAWVKNDANYKRIMNLITLTIPASIWAPAKAYALGDCVLPVAPSAEPTLYYQCSTLGTSVSAAAEPTWPVVPGNTCKDGTVDWVCRDIGECVSFGNLAFRYSDPAKHAQNLGAVEFIRLLRFIRLWKKLDWTVEQTDTAICTLYRADLGPLEDGDLDNVSKLDTGFLTLLPRLGIVSRVMRALNLNVKHDLPALLTCFASIGVHDGEAWVSDGEGGLRQQIVASLYRQMFLTPTLLKQDDVFGENVYGQFLTDTNKKIADHTEVLRSAFNLTGEELSLIAAELDIKILLQTPYSHPQPSLDQAILRAAPGIGYDDSSHRLSYPGTLSTKARDDLKAIAGVHQEFKDAVDALFAANPTLTPLTIPNISDIFRRGWLARKLKISVHELLLLIKFTGLDPFTVPDPANPAILRLIELVRMMRDRSFKSVAALYLIWNQDLSGKSAPAPAQIAELARTLRGDYAAINDQFAAAEDPNGDVARARLTLVYGQETSDAFFALLDDALTVDAAYTHASPALEPDITAADPAIDYDDFRHRLSHRGLVTTDMQGKLNGIAGVSQNFKNTVNELVAKSEDIKGSFFGRNKELQQPYEAVLSLDGDPPMPGVNYAQIAQTFAGITATDSRITYDDGTHRLVATVDYTHSSPSLEKAITDTDKRISYDNNNHRLSYKGFFTIPRRDLLKRVPGVDSDFQSAIDTLFALSQKARSELLLGQLDPQLARQRKRQQTLQRLSIAAGADPVLTQTVLDPIRLVIPASTWTASKSYAVGDRVLPAKPGTEAVRYYECTTAGTSSASEPTWLMAPGNAQNDGAVTWVCRYAYPLHKAGVPSTPALDDALALETPGLYARFFFRDTATDPVNQEIPASILDYASGGGNPLPNPGNAISGIWSGLIEAPEAGFYNFAIETDNEASVTLTLAGQARALTQNGTIRRNTDPIELKAGTLYEVELKVEKIKDKLSLQWETPKRPREVIPPRYLYPKAIFEPFTNTYIRFLKAASLAADLGLTANELAFFATHSDYRIDADGWLNALTTADDPQPGAATALLMPFESLLDFARIKADLSPSDESLLAVLQDPAAATQDLDSLMFSITRWNAVSLHDVLGRFGSNIAGLEHFNLFRRVYDAFALVQTLSISAHALIQAVTNEPDGNTVRDLQAALRARYDAESWRDVIRPINNEMRSLQRDALVAYILHQMRSHPESAHIDTPDKLFEYFLMDVQMDPCMQTSRIRHALSSVQLFIDRCLMNLESRVSPAAINAKQWEWMKRYRVWEANRKVYLFPENWLEPELRDDQSPFFKETMSELLQGDITEDRAAVALLNYLAKLEEVAKLEPCGIHHIPRDAAKRTPEINHVVARTAGASRKYFYRRYDGGVWTPWEQIKLDIEDNPVIPVVWNERLFLFWLRILKKGPDTAQKPPAGKVLTQLKTDDIPGDPQVTVQAVLCWSEYYNGKWQATKTSDVNLPTFLDTLALTQFDRSTLHIGVANEGDALRLYLKDSATYSEFISIDFSDPDHPKTTIFFEKNWPGSFLLYNTHSLPIRGDDPVKLFGLAIAWPYPKRDFIGNDQNDLTFRYTNLQNQKLIRNKIVKPTMPFKLVTPRHQLDNAWDAPFFYEDRRHIFYVTTMHKMIYVGEWDRFLIDSTQYAKTELPPLMAKAEVELKPKLWETNMPIGVGPGVVDPAPIERYITEDAYINKAIGTTSSVIFGEKQIGPSGAVSNTKKGI